ncbi:hypothetical protein [Nonomuraea wenchangensis]|uniref:hypothetical protein n=1 Tax=Nonomuraea wenchangensis TaxID=568860 RepID=UPI00331CF818
MSVPTHADPLVPRVVRPAGLDWVKFDAELARDGSVDPVDKALYAALASFVDSDDRDSDPDPDGDDVPTRARLAECIGRSIDTVDRVTKRLEERGLLRVHRRRNPDNPREHLPSVYELLDYERWDERAAARAQARREARKALAERGGSRTDAARGSRTDAARGSRTDAARGSRTDAALLFREGGEREEITPSPPSPRVTPDAPTPARAEGGEGEDPAETTPAAETPDAPAAAAAEWVLALPWRRQPSRRQRERLAALVVAAWAAGWSREALRRELVAELAGAHSLFAVWESRLSELPAPPATGPAAASSATGPACPTHPGASQRADGQCAGCWADRLTTDTDRRLMATGT